MIFWVKNITESVYVCKYHSSVLLLRHLDLWSSAQSVEVRTFTTHRNSFLTSTVSSPRQFRPVSATFVRGAETLGGVIWTAAGSVLMIQVLLSPRSPGHRAGALTRVHLHEAKILLQHVSHCKLRRQASELHTQGWLEMDVVHEILFIFIYFNETVTPGDCYRADTFTVES